VEANLGTTTIFEVGGGMNGNVDKTPGGNGRGRLAGKQTGPKLARPYSDIWQLT
jgi:hypothetical protein